jgi:hypothetical protein
MMCADPCDPVTGGSSPVFSAPPNTMVNTLRVLWFTDGWALLCDPCLCSMLLRAPPPRS